YYGNQRQLEYDFRVSPRSNPSLIEFAFSGVKHASITEEGDLSLDTNAGVLTHRRPVAFQERHGTREAVEARFVLHGKNRVGFALGAYDHDLPLVIDPVLVYSSYFGGTDATGLGDQGNGVAVDPSGNAYIAGVTSSTDFPVQNGITSSSAGGLDA